MLSERALDQRIEELSSESSDSIIDTFFENQMNRDWNRAQKAAPTKPLKDSMDCSYDPIYDEVSILDSFEDENLVTPYELLREEF